MLKYTILVCLTLLANYANYAQSQSSNEVTEFNLAFSTAAFTHVNEMDAKASIQIWANKYAEGWEKLSGTKLKVNIIVLDDEFDFDKNAINQIPSILSISSLEYLRNESLIKEKPYVVGTIGEAILEEMLLLTRKDSGINDLLQLKNKKIIMIGGFSGQLAYLWIGTLILKASGEQFEKYLGVVEKVGNPSKAVLDVYFNKFDACIIDKHSFRIITEMNPQLKNELIILKQSKGLLQGVSFFKNSPNEDFNKFVLDYALKLPTDEYSKQLKILFRINNIVLFKEEYLENIRELFIENKKLKSRL